jgi:hypothetical protein
LVAGAKAEAVAKSDRAVAIFIVTKVFLAGLCEGIELRLDKQAYCKPSTTGRVVKSYVNGPTVASTTKL